MKKEPDDAAELQGETRLQLRGVGEMSHAYGQVRFGDGLILHFEYDGTSDVCLPHLWSSPQEVMAHWRRGLEWQECKCGREIPEPVIIAHDYGNGEWWYGGACRDCYAILDNCEPPDNAHDGLPIWWQK